MLVEDVETRRTEIALRQEAHYWRALHARAVEREAAWKEKAGQLERTVRDQAARIAELSRENETLKARVTWLEQQVFGRKSERTRDATPEDRDGDGKVPGNHPAMAMPRFMMVPTLPLINDANGVSSRGRKGMAENVAITLPRKKWSTICRKTSGDVRSAASTLTFFPAPMIPR